MLLSRAAFVTRVLEQTGPRGHQASTRPGQVQTAHLAPRSWSIRAGRMPTAPVTTDHHLHPVRGPGSRHPCREFRTSQKLVSLPDCELAVGIWRVATEGPEASGRTGRQTIRVRPKEVEWRVKGWSQMVTDLLL